MGGFFWAKPNDPDLIKRQGFIHVGFDIEQIVRVQPQTAQRVCATQDEFTRAPSPAALWCAKEASFKSLKGAHQPLVLSEIEIKCWGCDSHCETFMAEYRHSLARLKSLGITFTKNDHQIAISFGIYENFDIKSFGGLTLV
jgi:phosphopantetheinyl transferase (holo-ACP synthase)